MKYNKKESKIILIHKNKDKKLKKKYFKILKKKIFLLNKNIVTYIELLFFNFNRLLKKNFKNFKIIVFLIWKSKHVKDLINVMKNLIKINKDVKIKIFKNIGSSRKFLKNIKFIIKI